MNPIAAILDGLVLYRYSLVLALAGAAGVCFFLACCSHRQLPFLRACGGALLAVALSLVLGRLVFWYGRPDRFSSLFQALTCGDSEAYALAGAMVGCALAAVLAGGRESRKTMLDCTCVAGCAAISLGRLGCFFTETDRGQIMVQLTNLPWAYPVANASGALEYRFAAFLFQAAVTAALGIFLAVIFFRETRPGDVTELFLLFYSCSQVLLDSTRYDSLYLRSNGFISIVQILCALTLAAVLALLSIRAVKTRGLQGRMIALWTLLAALFGCVGYMEYYVQRHGREAAFAYSVMGLGLGAIAALGLYLRRMGKLTMDN